MIKVNVRPTCISAAVATAWTLTTCVTALSIAWMAPMRATAASAATAPTCFPSAVSAAASAPPLARSVRYMATCQPRWLTAELTFLVIFLPPGPFPLQRGVSAPPATSSTRTLVPALTPMNVWARYTGANTSASMRQGLTPAAATPAFTWGQTARAVRAKVSCSDCGSGSRAH